MTRLLTEEEIENMLSFIKPQPAVPLDTAMSVVNINKARLRLQLQGQKVYPQMIIIIQEPFLTPPLWIYNRCIEL